jgi:hypothetical protein
VTTTRSLWGMKDASALTMLVSPLEYAAAFFAKDNE